MSGQKSSQALNVELPTTISFVIRNTLSRKVCLPFSLVQLTLVSTSGPSIQHLRVITPRTYSTLRAANSTDDDTLDMLGKQFHGSRALSPMLTSRRISVTRKHFVFSRSKLRDCRRARSKIKRGSKNCYMGHAQISGGLPNPLYFEVNDLLLPKSVCILL